MIIKKNDKEYVISETAQKWIAKLEMDKVVLKYEISKKDCPTFESLESFMANEDLI